MDDNCGEWVESMGVASGCGEQEVGVASGSGWNLWVWLLGVVVRRYSRHQKKVPISCPYNRTGNSVLFPFRSRLISVRLPFSNRSRFVPRAARPFW